MDKQNKTFTELTPDQMDRITGGTGSSENFGYNEEPFFNGNADIKLVECPNSPTGFHNWKSFEGCEDFCTVCGQARSRLGTRP